MSTLYLIRVGGLLDDHWSERLGGHPLTRHADGTTTITADVLDQAQLHGMLTAIRDIGAALLEVRLGPARAVPALRHTLVTDRLTLRAASVDDAARTWRYRRLPEVNEWLDGPLPDLKTYTAHVSEPERLAATVVVVRREEHAGTDAVVGDLMLRITDSWSQREVADQARRTHAEVGWVLHPAHTRHGYAAEAVRALLRHCFDDLGIHRVTAECFLGNEASWRLMERVGLRREVHTRRDALHRSGEWLDSVRYAVLADEWVDADRPLRDSSTTV